MNFKTKKGTYKLWQIDVANVYAYDVNTKAKLIVNVNDFNKWVDNGSIRLFNYNEGYIDEKRFKLPK